MVKIAKRGSAPVLYRGIALTAAIYVALFMHTGCARRPATFSAAFPIAHVASPWALDGEVWEGGIAAAAAALGDDAAVWTARAPQCVRLAVYRHEDRPQQRLIVRAFEFADAATAQRVRDEMRPLDATDYKVADGGYWSDLGVVFTLGPQVVEIFGTSAEWQSQISASYVAGLMVRRADGK